MQEKMKILITEEQIVERVKELGATISQDYKGEVLTLVCILKGGVVFTVDLAKVLDIDVELEFLEVSSYGNSRVSSGIVKINKDLDSAITGKNVLVVEDVIDSGRTLVHIMRHLEAQQPKSLKVCTFLDKPSRRESNTMMPDYTGFTIKDEFVIGYGLDNAQKCRNLPYIAVLEYEK